MSDVTRSLRELDQRHVWHPFTHNSLWLKDDPLVITGAQGFELIDSDGNRYVDGVASLWCNVHGHRVPAIDAAIRAQVDRVAHTTLLGLTNEPATRLAARLAELAPRGLTRVFYADAGACATEIAFKMAVQYWANLGRPRKREFVGFVEGYHGDTAGAMSVGRSIAFQRPFVSMLFPIHSAPSPYVYRWRDGDATAAAVGNECLAALEAILQQHASTIAAISIEPLVQAAAGMIVHPEGFLRGVRALADRYDVLLICDEIAVGFGRTGKMFACEHEDVSPDLLCIGKGLTGGYLPLAATMTTDRIFDAFLGDPWEGKTFFHGHTYTGNPLACAAALASIALFDHSDLLAHVNTVASLLASWLAPLRDHPHVGDVRQRGLLVGIELVADRATRHPFDPRQRVGAELCRRVRRHGVILRPLGDVIVIVPPLAIDPASLRRIVDAVTLELANLPEPDDACGRGGSATSATSAIDPAGDA